MRYFILTIVGLYFGLGCSPSISGPDPDQSKSSEISASTFVAEPCGTFSDCPNPDDIIETHVLYRDNLKRKNYKSAFPLWKKAYTMAPAADGKRSTHFLDGVTLYEQLIAEEKDSTKINDYIGEIFKLYDHMDDCYGGDGYIEGLKAFDLYYNYKGRASNMEVWDLFTSSMDTDADTANVFIINPMSDLLVKSYFNEEISLEKAQYYTQKILARIEKAKEDDKDNREQWTIVEGYAPQRLEILEGVKGFFDCSHYRSKYYESLSELPTDCDELREVYSKLKWGGCPDGDEAYARLTEALKANCAKLLKTTSGGGYKALQEGRYDEAISLFEEAASKTDDIEKKSRYEMLIAKIYYAHLKNFREGRKWALIAAQTKPNWGDPFMLIGRMYASSGPLCGPGRGWDSQIVTWPAIDKWQHAKSIDPSVAAEANKWINRYAQYMPKLADGFQRGISEGESFRVGCWIQENTRVRFAK